MVVLLLLLPLPLQPDLLLLLLLPLLPLLLLLLLPSTQHAADNGGVLVTSQS